jgi:PadR family transcriptional regulator, regulatory protein PadR
MGSEPRMTLQTQSVLKVLLDNPMTAHYGLEIARRVGLPSGTTYPILARLEQAGWVASEWEEIDQAAEGRRRRRHYRLTAKGTEHSRHILADTVRRIAPNWGLSASDVGGMARQDSSGGS